MSKRDNNEISQEDKKDKIAELRRLVREEGVLCKFPYVGESYLERFLGGTNFNVSKAFEKIKSNHELILEYPEWFTKEPPLAKQDLIRTEIRVALSETDKDGRPIYIVKVGNVDPSKMTLLDVIAVDDIWMESILIKFASESGLCILLDIANLPWSSLKWLTPHNIKIGVRKLLCLPFRDYRFHIVNNSMLMNATIKIMWPFLPQNIKETVKFHFNNRESLHSFIDPAFLPNEYGGTNEKVSFDNICEELFAQNEQIFHNFRTHRSFEMTY